ncbi:short chain dehydrogenase [Pseudomonas aeruginosa]|nr:short chain dehydrogenase [Pseudomonas aeruginosa]
MSLHGKTLFITGASRGIGREIALRAARDGANLVIAAKSAEPHPKLEGTIFSVAAEVEAAGGQALPLQLDVRDEQAVAAAMARAAERFGGIDAAGQQRRGDPPGRGGEAGAQALRPDVPDQHPRGAGLQPGRPALPAQERQTATSSACRRRSTWPAGGSPSTAPTRSPSTA